MPKISKTKLAKNVGARRHTDEPREGGAGNAEALQEELRGGLLPRDPRAHAPAPPGGDSPHAGAGRGGEGARRGLPMFFLPPSWNGVFSNFYCFVILFLTFQNLFVKISKIFVAKSQGNLII